MCLEDLFKEKFSIYKVGYSMRQYSMSTVSFCAVQVVGLYVGRRLWETGWMSPGLRLSTREANSGETLCYL